MPFGSILPGAVNIQLYHLDIFSVMDLLIPEQHIVLFLPHLELFMEVVMEAQLSIIHIKNKFIIGANTSETADTFPGIACRKTGGSADAIVVEHTHGHTLSPSVSVSGGNLATELAMIHILIVSLINRTITAVYQVNNEAENTEKTPQVIVDDDHTGENRSDSEAISAASTGITGTNAASTGITINN